MSSIKILVTGANGQLGCEFRDLALRNPDIVFVFTDRASLPIENTAAVDKLFSENNFTHCINCAAYTAVDLAEINTDDAFLVNATAVKHIAQACHHHNVFLFHFSTDYVFSGAANKPYKETDETEPVNRYAESKLAGEDLARKHNERTIIIRTSWVYSRYGHNFVKTMVRLMKEKSRIGVVADQIGSPTYAADLAESVIKILLENPDPAPGIYHYCNRGIISWFDFAEAIKEIIKSECVVSGIQTSAYPTAAKRPAFSALDTHKIQSVFEISIPQWKDSLARCLEAM